MDWHFTARVILFRSMDQACCIVYRVNKQIVYACTSACLQGKAAENHCATTAKYISTSSALAACVTLSIMRISKVSL